MTKPTGRPRGRPKTKEYVTLMARVPQDLATRVQRYAGLHRQTISDVLRDGLLVLLQEEEPPRFYMSDINTEPENMSDTKMAHSPIMSDTKEGHATRETQPDIESDEKEAYSDIVSDMKEGDATQDVQSVIMSDVKEDDADAYITSDTKDRKPDNASDSNAGTEKASDTKEVSAAIVSDANAVSAIVSDAIPHCEGEQAAEQPPAAPLRFDPAKHKLGSLCKNKHAWEGTEQSVRYKSNGMCVVCNAERVNERRRQRRTARARK